MARLSLSSSLTTPQAEDLLYTKIPREIITPQLVRLLKIVTPLEQEILLLVLVLLM
jgi:hypothetical protein